MEQQQSHMLVVMPQLLVLDHLPAHKSSLVDRLPELPGVRVPRLARYSPDYNPIEMAISKAKNLLRALAARSINGLIDAIGQSLLSITANDARNYIGHCGYAATVE